MSNISGHNRKEQGDYFWLDPKENGENDVPNGSRVQASTTTVGQCINEENKK
ncbi:unnamed protein product, partial [Brachionus calyciflorus]